VALGSGAEPAVIAEGIARSFGRIKALRGVSLRIPEGSIHGLLGPNGAGKTTLFRILTGQIAPDEGSARVAGLDPTRDAALLRSRIGVLFDTQNLYPRLSVRENLILFRAIYGVAMARVDMLLARFDLVSRAGSRVETLSHGMRQKVLLARALLHDPDILFLDEPTTGLDPNWAVAVHGLISEARDSGATVVLATHQMETAEALCDTVSIIDGGAIVASDTPRDLKLRYGKRTLRVDRAANGQRSVVEIPLDGPGAAERIASTFAAGHVFSAHTSEATLADVFREVTGRVLGTAE
jgi:ABC-2 type transport system ATP-binding protein